MRSTGRGPRRGRGGAARLLLPALVGGVLLWNGALAAAPHALRGRAGGGAVAAAAVVYAAASFFCHQRAERSFHPGGVKAPVCGRCAGLYAGALLGLLGAGFRVRAPALRALLAAAAFPTAAAFVLEAAGAADPGNAGRAAAAVPLGAAVCWFVAAAIRGKVH